MIVTFVDTSFLIALLRKKDVHHERASAWQKVVTGRVLTTEYVLIEFADAMSLQPLRRRAVEIVGQLRGDVNVRVVPVFTALMDEGLALFTSREDKRWSLTNCISFAVVQRDGISDALTSDPHFEQAGFRALLRRSPPSGERIPCRLTLGCVQSYRRDSGEQGAVGYAGMNRRVMVGASPSGRSATRPPYRRGWVHGFPRP